MGQGEGEGRRGRGEEGDRRGREKMKWRRGREKMEWRKGQGEDGGKRRLGGRWGTTLIPAMQTLTFNLLQNYCYSV